MIAFLFIWAVLSTAVFLYIALRDEEPAWLDEALDKGGSSLGVRLAIVWLLPGFYICFIFSAAHELRDGATFGFVLEGAARLTLDLGRAIFR